VPSGVLAQLANRVQHALRAFTPDDAKALKATVSTFPTSDYDLAQLLTQLGTGEAVVTVLSERGAPTPVAWTRMRAPLSLMAPSPDATVAAAVAASSIHATYATAVDRQSAYEMLAAKLAQASGPATTGGPKAGPRSEPRAEPAPRSRSAKPEDSTLERVVKSSAFKSFTRSAATVIGREISRSIFGVGKRR
jgi:hypothetical protein